MKYGTVCKLEAITQTMVNINCFIFITIDVILYIPIYLLKELKDWLQKKYEDYQYRHKHRDLYEANIKREEWKKKIEARELDTTGLPHDRLKTKHSFGDNDFHFYRTRKYVMPFDSIVYVENAYNDRIHKFFENRKDLIQKWSDWHGWKIEFIDKELIKEGMIFPQDYDNDFHHGFLWFEHGSTCEPEYHIDSDLHYYYEIEPTTDENIIHQMDLIMSKIYKKFEWQLA